MHETFCAPPGATVTGAVQIAATELLSVGAELSQNATDELTVPVMPVEVTVALNVIGAPASAAEVTVTVVTARS